MQEFAWHPADLAEELQVLRARGYSVARAAEYLGVGKTKAYEALRYARARDTEQ